MSLRLNWYHTVNDDDRGVFSTQTKYTQIGRGENNDISWNNHSVADHAFVIELNQDGWQLVVLDGNSVDVNGINVFKGEAHSLTGTETISLFPYVMNLEVLKADTTQIKFDNYQLDEEMNQLIRKIHVDLIQTDEHLLSEIHNHLDKSKSRKFSDNADEQLLIQKISNLEIDLESISERHGITTKKNRDLVAHLASNSLKSSLLSLLITPKNEELSEIENSEIIWNKVQTLHPNHENQLRKCIKHFEKILYQQNDAEVGTNL